MICFGPSTLDLRASKLRDLIRECRVSKYGIEYIPHVCLLGPLRGLPNKQVRECSNPWVSRSLCWCSDLSLLFGDRLCF